MPYVYADKILQIDLTTHQATIHPVTGREDQAFKMLAEVRAQWRAAGETAQSVSA